eukprot:TRINITY_DN3012_c0_g3_i1.p1 TRINITY_DN3012_c0_g3~~TRINITY_DN3012_c0_g3_i1.p1  ORF type:complete len:356 (+),score=88.31 TRINITY_DN3012_c0_g3_i1:38-1105(+)
MFKNSKYSFKKSSDLQNHTKSSKNVIYERNDKNMTRNNNLTALSTMKMEFSNENDFSNKKKTVSSNPSLQNQLIIPNVNDIQARKNFFNTPLPIGLTFQCRVMREKSGTFGSTKKYYLYCENPDEFLMSAEYKSQLSGSSFEFFDSNINMMRESNNYLGKLEKGRFSDAWVLYDFGESPKHILANHANASKNELDILLETQSRTELGVFVKPSNISDFLANQHHFAVNVYLPDEKCVFKPKVENDTHSLESMIKNAPFLSTSSDHYYRLFTKNPSWDYEKQVYSLNFENRIIQNSIKNFQITMKDEQREKLNISSNEDEVILQFGKMGKDSYILDFSAPFTPFQAFATAMLAFEL